MIRLTTPEWWTWLALWFVIMQIVIAVMPGNSWWQPGVGVIIGIPIALAAVLTARTVRKRRHV